MAFNIGNISGLSDSLLNEASKELKNTNSRTEFISFDLLDPSALNKELSKDKIDELADQIYQDGLDQPLVVFEKPDGRYEILAGERRYLAIKKLIELDKYNEDKLIECKIKRFSEKDTSLSIEDQKMFTWLTTNQYRAKTDNDKYIEALRWKDIFLKLKKAGIKFIAEYDENGNSIQRDISGIRTRQLISEQVGLSPAQVGKIEKINKNGSEKLKEAIKEDKISIAKAAHIASLSEDKQDIELEKIISNTSEDTTVILNKDELVGLINELNDIKNEYNEKSFSDKDIKKLKKCFSDIIKILID